MNTRPSPERTSEERAQPSTASGARAARDRRERIRRARRTPWRPILVISGICLVAIALLITRHILKNAPPPITDLVVVCQDEAGAPLSDIEIRFFDAQRPRGEAILECESDESGRAVLPKDRALGSFFCLGRSAELGAVSQCFIEQGDRKCVLTLAAPQPIAGLIEDEEGLPVPSVDIEARLVGGPILEQVRSDDAGRFALRQISKTTLLVQLTARHRGHENAQGTWYRKNEGELVMTLARTQALSFRILGPEGAPAAELPVSIVGPDYKDFVTTTDARGRCEFHGLKLNDNYFVLIEHPSLTYRWRSYSPKADLHTIRLQEPATLEGRAVDAGNAPRPGVEIRHRHGPRRWVRTRTDKNGSFKIGDLPAGPVELFWDAKSEGGSLRVEVKGARLNRDRTIVLK